MSAAGPSSKKLRAEGGKAVPQPAKAASRAAAKTVFKVALDSPFAVQWPKLESAAQDRVMDLLRAQFGEIGEQRLQRQVEISRAWLVNKRGNTKWKAAGDAAEGEGADLTKQAPPKQIPLPKGVVTGYNAASRACEQKRVRMLFVCRDLQPAVFCQHFPLLAHHSSALLVPLSNASASLGLLFGIPRLAVFAIEKDTPQFDSLVGAISPLVSPVVLDWLPTDDPQKPALVNMRYKQIPLKKDAKQEAKQEVKEKPKTYPKPQALPKPNKSTGKPSEAAVSTQASKKKVQTKRP